MMFMMITKYFIQTKKVEKFTSSSGNVRTRPSLHLDYSCMKRSNERDMALDIIQASDLGVIPVPPNNLLVIIHNENSY